MYGPGPGQTRVLLAGFSQIWPTHVRVYHTVCSCRSSFCRRMQAGQQWDSKSAREKEKPHSWVVSRRCCEQRDPLGQSSWSEPPAVAATKHTAWPWGLLSPLPLTPLQLVATDTHVHCQHDAPRCMDACMCANTGCVAGADRSWGGKNSCKPLIRSAQIWYHCNQISDGAEYSISGFGQSSVTFVAEKWHGALVLNAITQLASRILRASGDHRSLHAGRSSARQQRRILLPATAEAT